MPSTLLAAPRPAASDRRDRLEAAFADMRVGRAAAASLAGRLGAGAVLVFDATVRGWRRTPNGPIPALFPARCSVEPGTYLTRGTTTVEVEALLPGWRVAGRFHVAVGAGEPAPAEFAVVRSGDDPEMPAPEFSFASVALPLRPPELVEHALRRLQRRGEDALTSVLEDTRALVHRLINSALAATPVPPSGYAELRDASFVISVERIYKLAERYCGAERPNAAWSKVVTAACARDVRRELDRLVRSRYGTETATDPLDIVEVASAAEAEASVQASIPTLLAEVFGSGEDLTALLPWIFRTGLLDDSDGHSLSEVAERFEPASATLSERRRREHGADLVRQARLDFFRRFARPGEDEDAPGVLEAWEGRALDAVRRQLFGVDEP